MNTLTESDEMIRMRIVAAFHRQTLHVTARPSDDDAVWFSGDALAAARISFQPLEWLRDRLTTTASTLVPASPATASAIAEATLAVLLDKNVIQPSQLVNSEASILVTDETQQPTAGTDHLAPARRIADMEQQIADLTERLAEADKKLGTAERGKPGNTTSGDRAAAEKGFEPPFDPWEKDHTSLVHILWDVRHRGLNLFDDFDEIATTINHSRWLAAQRHDAAENGAAR
ncbi:hypothetical protein [Leifsonia sp. Leaf264]|uniref:hypothetical protein n=1 Tax=Leifsonia sp. Leaf264 TaxID=1736314 RepID=UPI000A8BCCCF|nr:hypothetical protein [Leifsonia sp. Leaf264]